MTLSPGQLEKWFLSVRDTLESAYLKCEHPWQQSGFSGPVERWAACRKPIADCVDGPGTFLDIGCANGYLLECLLAWTSERGIEIEPWALDLSKKLTALARQRLPDWAENLEVGNAYTWRPPQRFDYVRTELCYVPRELPWQYVERVVDEFLAPDGKLLVAEYRSRRDNTTKPWADEQLRRAGFAVMRTESGWWQGKELTRVAVVPKARPRL